MKIPATSYCMAVLALAGAAVSFGAPVDAAANAANNASAAAQAATNATQAANGAANASSNAANAANAGANAANAANSAGAAANGAMGANVAAPGADASAGASGSVGAADRTAAGVQNGSVNAQSGVAGNVSDSARASAAVNPTATVQAIRTSAAQDRAQVATDVDARVRASEQEVASLRRTGEHLDAQARSHLEEAIADAQAKGAALKQTLERARNASEQEWTDTRDRLASDYEAYATAVTHAEVAASGNAQSSNN